MAGSADGMEFDYSGGRGVVALGLSDDAATAPGGSDRTNFHCRGVAEGLRRVGGDGAVGGSGAGLACRGALSLLGDDCDDGRAQVVASEPGADTAEYLALLEPGSGTQQALRRMTQLFERIWYGLRPAAESDYTNAQTLFDEPRSA